MLDGSCTFLTRLRFAMDSTIDLICVLFLTFTGIALLFRKLIWHDTRLRGFHTSARDNEV
jgi:hypothetical protein